MGSFVARINGLLIELRYKLLWFVSNVFTNRNKIIRENKMTKEQLMQRIEMLKKSVDQSKAAIEQAHAAHNSLIGRLAEANDMMKMGFDEVEKLADEVKEVIGEVVE